MNNRATIALIVVFFAGLIGLWYADQARVPDRKARERAEPRVLPGLVDIKPDQVRKVEIAGGEAPIVFERREGNRWQMVAPIETAADPSKVEALALNLKLLEKARDVGTLPTAPDSFGLGPPARTVRLFGDDPSRPIASLEVGKLLRGFRFVRPAGAQGAEVVDAKALAAVELPPTAWRDRQLIRISTFQVAAVEAVGPGRNLRLERERDAWRITSPFRAPADEGRVEGALGEVVSLRVADGDLGFVKDDVKDLAAFGLDPPRLTITVTPRPGSGTPQTVHLGGAAPSDDKGSRSYARRDGQDDVVIVDDTLLKDLGVRPLDLHGKRVSDLRMGRVDAIRLGSGEAAVTVARGERGWVRLSPQVDQADQAAVVDLLKKLDGLEATALFGPDKAPDAQLDRPWAVLEVWQESAATASESGPTAPPGLRLELGRRDALNKVVYGRLGGDPVVMALPIAFLEGLTPGPLAFRDRQVAAAPAATIESIVVQQGPRTVEVVAPTRGGQPADWRMEKPVRAPADPETLGRLLALLGNLRAETLVADRSESDAKFGLDRPSLTATWTSRLVAQPSPLRPTGGESTTLSVGLPVPGPGKQGARYARVSGSPIVFTLPAESLAVFESEYRDKRVIQFDIKNVDRLRLSWPRLSVEARPVPDVKADGPDWTLVDPPAGLALDAGRIKPLLASLSKLVTFRFAQYDGPIGPETGLFPPRCLIEVSAGGPPRELRLGVVTRDGYLQATTSREPTGMVFLLPLRGWEDWTRPPAVGGPPTVPAGPAEKKAEAPPK